MITQALCCCTRIQLSRGTPIYRKLENYTLRQTIRSYSFENKMNFKKHQRHFQNNDEMDPGFELIYKAPLRNYILAGIGVITGTSTVIFGTVLIQYLFYGYIPSEPLVLDGQVFISSQSEFIGFCGIMLVLLLMVKVVVSRYVIRLYCNGDQYSAVYRSLIPGKKIKVYFNDSQVVGMKTSRFAFMGIHGFKLNNKKSILFPEYFRTPRDFYLLIGGNNK